VATTIRTLNNIYVLNEIGKESCCLGKENESWLWHGRMSHMNFDNLVKISRKDAVKEILEISKTVNSLCKHWYMENRSGPSSNQSSTQQKNHWILYIPIYVDQQEQMD